MMYTKNIYFKNFKIIFKKYSFVYNLKVKNHFKMLLKIKTNN